MFVFIKMRNEWTLMISVPILISLTLKTPDKIDVQPVNCLLCEQGVSISSDAYSESKHTCSKSWVFVLSSFVKSRAARRSHECYLPFVEGLLRPSVDKENWSLRPRRLAMQLLLKGSQHYCRTLTEAGRLVCLLDQFAQIISDPWQDVSHQFQTCPTLAQDTTKVWRNQEPSELIPLKTSSLFA